MRRQMVEVIVETGLDSATRGNTGLAPALALPAAPERSSTNGSLSSDGDATFFAEQTEVPFKRRLGVLLNRAFKYFVRNPGNFIARVFVCLFLGFLVGFVYQNTASDQSGADNRLRVLYFLSLIIVLVPFQTITLFQDMRQYYLRERSSRLYNSLEYFLANLILECSLVIICTFLFLTPAYWLVGLRQDAWAFFFAYFQYTVMYLVSSTFMTLVSNIAPNIDISFAMGAFFMSIFNLFRASLCRWPIFPAGCAGFRI